MKVTIEPQFRIRTIFESVGEIEFPGTQTPFVASEAFLEDRFFLGNNFRMWMLPKTEDPQVPSVLHVEKALRPLTDNQILAFKGGEKAVETTLAELRYAVSLQPNGPDSPGALRTDDGWNRFYIRAVSEVLRSVGACWHGGRWHFNANALGDYYLDGGRRLVSRN